MESSQVRKDDELDNMLRDLERSGVVVTEETPEYEDVTAEYELPDEDKVSEGG